MFIWVLLQTKSTLKQIHFSAELKEVQDIEKQIDKAEQNGNIQDKGNDYCRTQYERL